VAIDLRIYEYIPLDGTVSLSQLAELAGADEAILSSSFCLLASDPRKLIS
jgi:hypothetical protein